MENLRQMLDGIDEANVSNIFGGMPSYHTPDGVMLEPKSALPLSYTHYVLNNKDVYNAILLRKGSAFTVDDGTNVRRIVADQDITINPKAMLDVNIGKESDLTELEHGTDYYIYVYVAGDTSNAVDIVVSKNSTYPDDESGSSPYTANNTRKIGGFHFGTVRIVSQNGCPVDNLGEEFSTGAVPTWKNNVINGMVVPNSIWDLCDTDGGRIPHRDGTVMIGGSWKSSNEESYTGHYSKKGGRFWCDIYLVSKDSGTISHSMIDGSPIKGNGKLVSAYGRMPFVGNPVLFVCGYNFIELAKKDGLRLLSYQDWLQVAYGSPQGENNTNIYGWTKTSNAGHTYTGCSVDVTNGSYSTSGEKTRAVSAWNVCDCVGNVSEYLSDFFKGQVTGSLAWVNMMPDEEVGQLYLEGSIGLVQASAGGYFSRGDECGCRTIEQNVVPWGNYTFRSSRFARDAL